MTGDDGKRPGPKASKPPPVSEDGKSEGGVISRWAARKHAVAQSEAAAVSAEIQARTQEAERTRIEARQRENRQKAEAIDIDRADYKTDFTPFLKDGVPPALRRQALKTLWRTNPILANVDGLNDYDEDFRAVGGAFEMIKSSWEVGRGYAGKAGEVTGEMEARDDDVRKARAAERDTDGEGTANGENDDDGDGDRDGDGDGDEIVADTPDPMSKTTAADTAPSRSKPRSGRASLRQRLLQDRE